MLIFTNLLAIVKNLVIKLQTATRKIVCIRQQPRQQLKARNDMFKKRLSEVREK